MRKIYLTEDASAQTIIHRCFASKALYFTLALVLGLTGCSDSPDSGIVQVASAQAGRGVSGVHGIRPQGAFRPDTKSMSEDEREKHFQRRREVTMAIHRAAKLSSWEEADAAIRVAISDLEGLPAYIYETQAATTMLNIFLAPGPGTPEALEATAFYTQMLIDNETPNGALMRRALTELEGTWTRVEQRTAAEATLASAERYAAWQSECVDCGSSQLRRAVEASGSERAMTYLYDAERLVAAYQK